MIVNTEDFESGLPGGFDSVGNVWGTPTATLDTTSKINKVNSVLFTNGGTGNASAIKTLGSSFYEIFIQLKGYIPSALAWGASGYAGFLQGYQVTPDTETWHMNIENYGTTRLTFSSTAKGYTDTGINLPMDTVFSLEIRVKMDASVGNISVWLNNTNNASPDYNSGNVNTGAVMFDGLRIGAYYIPEATKNYWLDYISVDNVFIGTRSSTTVTYSQLSLLGVG